jgi:hypothetical protein
MVLFGKQLRKDPGPIFPGPGLAARGRDTSELFECNLLEGKSAPADRKKRCTVKRKKIWEEQIVYFVLHACILDFIIIKT